MTHTDKELREALDGVRDNIWYTPRHSQSNKMVTEWGRKSYEILDQALTELVELRDKCKIQEDKLDKIFTGISSILNTLHPPKQSRLESEEGIRDLDGKYPHR